MSVLGVRTSMSLAVLALAISTLGTACSSSRSGAGRDAGPGSAGSQAGAGGTSATTGGTTGAGGGSQSGAGGTNATTGGITGAGGGSQGGAGGTSATTGGTTGAGGGSRGGTGGTTAGGGSGTSSAGCPSATSKMPTQLIAVGTTPLETVVGMRGDGSVVDLWTGTESPGVTVQGDLAMAERGSPVGGTQHAYLVALFDRTGKMRWQVQQPLAAQNNSYRYASFLNTAGAAAVALTTTGQEESGFSVLPNGTLRDLGGIRPEAAPDSAGWLPSSTRIPNSSSRTWGFVNANDGRTQPLRMQMTRNVPPLIVRGRFVYQSTVDNLQFGIAVDDPSGGRYVPIPLPEGGTTDFSLYPADAGVVVVVAGAPRWLLRDSGDLQAITVPAGAVAGALRTTIGGPWAVVFGDDFLPRWRVRLDTLTVSLLDALPAPGPTQTQELPLTTAIRINGDWAMGVTAAGDVWRADLTSGHTEYADPWPVLAMRTFGCGSEQPSMASDGTLMMSLRDDALAGFYAAAPGAAWTRIGQPYTQVGRVSGRRLGDAYVVAAVDRPSYCNTTNMNWTTPPAGTPQPLRAPMGQVIFAGTALPPIDTHLTAADSPLSFMLLHPSGACGLASYKVYNFATGETFDFMSNAGVSFWF